jgi:hypothetical protein
MQDDSLSPSGSTHGAKIAERGSAERKEGAGPKTTSRDDRVSKAEREFHEADDQHIEAVREFRDFTQRIRRLRKSGTQAGLGQAGLDQAQAVRDATKQERERKVEALRKAKAEVRNLDKAV